MNVRVRDAERGDVEVIWAIYNGAVATTTATWDHEPVTLADRMERFEAARAHGWALLVAELEGTVVGFGAWAPFRAKRGWSLTMEHSLYLAPAAQGQGLGRRLLAELIDRGRAAGVHSLVGVLDGTNEASVRLHASAGFVEVGRLPQAGFKFGRWLDAVLVMKTLDAAAPPQ